jgi:hypothetical protein
MPPAPTEIPEVVIAGNVYRPKPGMTREFYVLVEALSLNPKKRGGKPEFTGQARDPKWRPAHAVQEGMSSGGAGLLTGPARESRPHTPAELEAIKKKIRAKLLKNPAVVKALGEKGMKGLLERRLEGGVMSAPGPLQNSTLEELLVGYKDPTTGKIIRGSSILEAVATKVRPQGRTYEEKNILGPIRDLLFGEKDAKTGRMRIGSGAGKMDPRGGAVRKLAKEQAEWLATHTGKWLGVPMDAGAATQFLHIVDTSSADTIKEMIGGEVPASKNLRMALGNLKGLGRFPEKDISKAPAEARKLWGYIKGRRRMTEKMGKGKAIRGSLAEGAARTAGRIAVPDAFGPPPWSTGTPILPEGAYDIPEVSPELRKQQVRHIEAAEKAGFRRDVMRRAAREGGQVRQVPEELLDYAASSGENIDDIIKEAYGQSARATGGEFYYGDEIIGRHPPGKFGELEKDVKRLYQMAESYAKKAKLKDPRFVHRIAAILGTVAGTAGERSQAGLYQAMGELSRVDKMVPEEVLEIFARAQSVGMHTSMGKGAKEAWHQHPGETRFILEQEGYAPGQGEQALKAMEQRGKRRYAISEGPARARMLDEIRVLQEYVEKDDVWQWYRTEEGSAARTKWIGPDELLDPAGIGQDPKSLVGRELARVEDPLSRFGEEPRGKWSDKMVEERRARLKQIARWKAKKVAASGYIAGEYQQGRTAAVHERHHEQWKEGKEISPEQRAVKERVAAASTTRGAEVTGADVAQQHIGERYRKMGPATPYEAPRSTEPFKPGPTQHLPTPAVPQDPRPGGYTRRYMGKRGEVAQALLESAEKIGERGSVVGEAPQEAAKMLREASRGMSRKGGPRIRLGDLGGAGRKVLRNPRHLAMLALLAAIGGIGGLGVAAAGAQRQYA